MPISNQPYTMQEHKHRFSAWAASRGASVKGSRFPVEKGQAILDRSPLRGLIEDPDALPTPQQIDPTHRLWRYDVIKIGDSLDLSLSHGVAAKLINLYLKAAFVCGGFADHPNVCALHPPIDSVLLEGLIDNNVGGRRDRWRYYAKIRWSKLNSDDYEALIRDIRAAMPPGMGLWEIEQYWRGFQ
jgi:hypothetical protein